MRRRLERLGLMVGLVAVCFVQSLWAEVDYIGFKEEQVVSKDLQIGLDAEGLEIYMTEGAYYNPNKPLTKLKGAVKSNYPIESISYILSWNGFEVNKGTLPPSNEWVIDPSPLVYGTNDLRLEVVDKAGNKASSEYLIIETGDGGDTDADKDNLSDKIERVLKTDLANKDTDRDGLLDGDEAYMMGTDPRVADTDNDGILDGREDFDQDGLANEEEVKYHTDPRVADSDSDELSDKKEIEMGTDPTMRDTDEDSLYDNEELEMGFNPLLKDSNHNGTNDGDEALLRNEQLVYKEKSSSYLINWQGSIPAKYSNGYHMMNDLSEDLFLTPSIPGYLTTPVEVKGTPLKAKLACKIEGQVLKGNNFKPAWFRLDADAQRLILVPGQKFNKSRGTVEIEVAEGGKYILLDKALWDKAWAIPLGSGKGVDQDQDGLTDQEESQLRLRTGVILKTNPKMADTDGDGILDGKELKAVRDKSGKIQYYDMWSNPLLKDTDGDGYIDGEE